MNRKSGRVAGMALALLGSAPAIGGACDGVAALHGTGLVIDRLTEVGPDKPFTPPIPGAAPMKQRFCRVEGHIEQEIGVELWLPERAAWNGRLLVGGVGGQAGNFNYYELVRGVSRGYASASTDTGHKASDTHWLLHRPDRALNYAERANHLLAVTTKQVVGRLYGKSVSHAFFVGCSGGGRQALTEVQRYPDDFDGVIAGAPGVNTPQMSARRLWEMQRHSEWGAMMPKAAWDIAYRGAIAQCDALDGKQDGVVADPRACHFKPESLVCHTSDQNNCLTLPQAAAVRTLFAPLVDEEGKRIDDGLLPTIQVSPAPLPEPFTPGPSYLATVLFAQGVYGDLGWDARTFNLARDLPAIDKVMNLHADSTAIEPFTGKGSKLILYQGWDDPLVTATSTLGWWQALSQRFGKSLDRSVRLFMLPGVDHCRGGPGEDLIGGAGGDGIRQDPHHDLLSALEQWVMRGRAPDHVIASKVKDGTVLSARPICAWPAQAIVVAGQVKCSAR